MTPRHERALMVLWPALMVMDPADQEKQRRRMLTYLGRYGRQSSREEDWWDTDLEEFKLKFEDLSEAIGEENATRAATEEDG